MGYRPVAMPYRSVGTMDDSLVYIVLGGTHSIGERQSLGELSSKSR